MEDLAHVCHCGAVAAEDVIRKALGVDIRKALDPLDPDDYIVIVARLGRAFSRSTAKTEVAILNRTLDALDVDWPNLSSAQRQRVIAASQTIYATAPPAVIPPVIQRLEVSGPRTVRGARRGARAAVPARFRSAMGVNLALVDKRVLAHLTSSQALFITDEYGRRRDDLGRISREIVARDLELGLGRDEITANLQARLGSTVGIQRSRSYWNVIAAAYTNRARTYGQLAAYSDARITAFIFEAVLDEVTTDQCRFLHGRRFPVQAGLSRYAASEAAEEPEAVKQVMPWIQAGRDAESGERILYTRNEDGSRNRVAVVERSGIGTSDDTGKFKNGLSDQELEALGSFMPPLHGRCRSTVAADV